MADPIIDESLRHRFWSKVDRRPGDACWTWTGHRCSRGYGRLQTGTVAAGTRQPVPAHRIAYLIAHGAIPDGLEVDHLCRNPGCVRASHLEAVTHAENVRRAAAAITHCPRGHEYTPANTKDSGGGRHCRTCDNARNLARYHRTKRLAG